MWAKASIFRIGPLWPARIQGETMAVVLPEGLVEMALRPWGRPAPGVVLDRTPERVVELRPNHPIPGPNSVSLIRCAPDRVEPMVAETRELAASHGLTCVWILDPDARPLDLPARLAACGIVPEEELAVMVLPASADLGAPDASIELVDALRDRDTFRAAEAVQVAAFGSEPPPRQDGRLADARSDRRKRFLLARVDGEPAGAGWATVFEEGVYLNGGAVTPRYRGRGVYRALVAARLEVARAAGVEGLGVQGLPETSAPILARLGFTEVGRIRVFVEAGA
jgi:GNAT superfamily N-acetyltransferase